MSWFGNGFITPRGRIYFDAAATSLMPRAVLEAQRAYFERACGNPHTEAHAPGRASTAVVEASRASVASLLGAPADEYATLFVGNGATGALNRAADVIGAVDSPRDTIVTTELEHHSNMLPWQRIPGARVRFVPMLSDGAVDLPALARLLRDEGHRVRALVVSGASNVTGARAPLRVLCQLAHGAGALCVVDAAQAAPHEAISMRALELDGLALSGHKLYAPGSPGVLILRRELFGAAPHGDVGGGAVERVEPTVTAWRTRIEDREEAGTPNVAGILGLGIVCDALRRTGMSALLGHNVELGRQLYDGLRAIPGVRVYGGRAPGGVPRLGTVAFNVGELPYGVVAALLDNYGIAVRDACFCAHPYVRALLANDPPPPSGSTPGMVRASCGPWNDAAQVRALLQAVQHIAANPDAARSLCLPCGDGSFVVGSCNESCFSFREVADRALSTWCG